MGKSAKFCKRLSKSERASNKIKKNKLKTTTKDKITVKQLQKIKF